MPNMRKTGQANHGMGLSQYRQGVIEESDLNPAMIPEEDLAAEILSFNSILLPLGKKIGITASAAYTK